MDEATLIESAMRGNIRAFNALVSVYHCPLLASARHLLRHADDADDLVQETLLEAYRRLGDLRETEKFKPWVFTILRHKCLRHLQRRQWRTEPLEEQHDTLSAPEAPETSILELLKELSPTDQRILIAHYLHGASYGEIAGQWGITVQAARMRCLRARERLRLLIARAEAEMRQVLAAAFREPALYRTPAAVSARSIPTGGLSMETYVLRYHLGQGQETIYRCEDILAMAANDYLYVIRYDFDERIELVTNGGASITVAFPHFRIIRPCQAPQALEADLPVDTSTIIRQTLTRRPNGEVENLHMHYTDGAFIAGMGEVIDAFTRGIVFPDLPLRVGEQWEMSRPAAMKSGDYTWESARHRLTDVDMRNGRQYAIIITKISCFMPVAPMWKAPDATETQGYGQTRELHVQTLFNITDGLVEQRSYSGTIINDTWLLEPERRHLQHDIIAVSGKAERVCEK